jgi:hypothetical protein
MAVSIYPKEANPLGEKLYNNSSSYLKSYSAHTFDYPYPKQYQYQLKIKEWNIL